MAIKDNNKTAVAECMLSNSEKHWDDDSNVMHTAIAKDGPVFLLSALGFLLYVYIFALGRNFPASK